MYKYVEICTVNVNVLNVKNKIIQRLRQNFIENNQILLSTVNVITVYCKLFFYQFGVFQTSRQCEPW